LFKILCVKCNALYIGGPKVQAREGPQPPSAGPAQMCKHVLRPDRKIGENTFFINLEYISSSSK